MKPPGSPPHCARRSRCWPLLVAGILVALGEPCRAAPLEPTPKDMRGPYYPDRLPADQDADLTRIAGRPDTARGKVLEFGGRVVDLRGRPQPGVRIEIWQTDATGLYIHSLDHPGTPRDEAFQGFGAVTADGDGRYAFRTVVPVAYASRPPHIHARLLRDGREVLVTQIYFADGTREPGVTENWASARDRGQTLRRLVRTEGGTLRGEFDFVLSD